MVWLVKFNINEYLLGLLLKVIEVICEVVDDCLCLYLDLDVSEFKDVIVVYYGVICVQVFVGNGFDEVFVYIFFGLFKQDWLLLFLDIIYSFYKVYCGFYDIDYCLVLFDDELVIDLVDYSVFNGGIIFFNFNVFIGWLLLLDVIEMVFVVNLELVVVIDEVYVDFGGDSVIVLVDWYFNLLVIQILFKFWLLVGLCIGFVVGYLELIEGLEWIKNSFNFYLLDWLVIVVGKVVFEDEDFFQCGWELVIEECEILCCVLEVLGFQVLFLVVNFLFCCYVICFGVDLVVVLCECGIIVCYFGKFECIVDYLWIMVGCFDQNWEFIEVLEEIFSS